MKSTLIHLFLLSVLFTSQVLAQEVALSDKQITNLARLLVADLPTMNIKKNQYPNKRIYMGRHAVLTSEKLEIIRDFGLPGMYQIANSTKRTKGTLSGKQLFVNQKLFLNSRNFELNDKMVI